MLAVVKVTHIQGLELLTSLFENPQSDLVELQNILVYHGQYTRHPVTVLKQFIVFLEEWYILGEFLVSAEKHIK